MHHIDRALARYDLVAPYRAPIDSYDDLKADLQAFREQVDRLWAALEYIDSDGAPAVLQRAVEVLAGRDVERLAVSLAHAGLAVARVHASHDGDGPARQNLRRR
jgi:hypothetical protein